MEFARAVIAWLVDPAQWSGPGGIPTRIGEHLLLSIGPLLAAVLVALPIGLYIGHTGRSALLAVNLANIGRALPSLGIIGIFLPITAGLGLGFGVPPTVIALFALAIPPIITNTYAGLREVDPELIEAGRGMGMRETELLTRVELPIAMPIVLAGLRTSAVQVVATATLGAVLGTGGLGRYIIDGIKQQDDPQLFVGAVIVALLAITTELSFAALQRAAVSPGIRRSGRLPTAVDAEVPRPSG
ncbi:MAG: ABC transporter permease [Chloroflexota bacterium]